MGQWSRGPGREPQKSRSTLIVSLAPSDKQGMRTGPDFEQSMLVAWAAGTVAAQVGCTFFEAVELMEERAAETARTLDEIALDAVERRIRFSVSLRSRQAS
jgi:hypothetical protein